MGTAYCFGCHALQAITELESANSTCSFPEGMVMKATLACAEVVYIVRPVNA